MKQDRQEGEVEADIRSIDSMTAMAMNLNAGWRVLRFRLFYKFSQLNALKE